MGYQIKRFISMFAVIMITLNIYNPAFVYANSDNNPPVVENIVLSSNEVAVGETVTVKAKITDDLTGVNRVYLYYDTPSKNRRLSISLFYNVNSGMWEGSYTILSTDEGGLWTFDYIYVEDLADNGKWYYAEDFETSFDFFIENDNGDFTPPIVESLEMSPTEVGVGETVTFKAKISDDIAGVTRTYLYYDVPSKNRRIGITLQYQEQSGLWEGYYTIKSTDEEGLWTFDYIYAQDVAGNGEWYRLGDFSNVSGLDFLVHNESGDSTPPTVQDIVVSPSEVGAGEAVTVKAELKDDVSGVTRAFLYYDSPSESRRQAIELYYQEESGVWVGDYIIKSTDEVGKWTFDYIKITDSAGNSKTYRIDDLSSFQNLDFTVNPELNINQPGTPYFITIHNEDWDYKVIDKDLYIGPNSILTIRGNVEITGDVYVYGALISYGDLSINGTLHAKNVRYGYGGTLYNGSAHIRSGLNNISSIEITNQPYDIPFTIFNENLSNETGSVNIEGRTLPFLNVQVKENPVELDRFGEFSTTIIDVYNDRIDFEVVDVFGHTMIQTVAIHDVVAPVRVENFKVKESNPTSINVQWNKNSETDVEEYRLYVNDKQVDLVPASNSTYLFDNLTENTDYELAITAVDSSNNISELSTIQVNTIISEPVIEEVSDRDNVIRGTAYPGATVQVLLNDETIGSDQVDTNGDFEVQIPKQVAGTTLKIKAIAENGVESAVVTIQVVDKTPPVIEEVEEINDQSTRISGMAEAGSKVKALVSETQIGMTTADGNGIFEMEIDRLVADTLVSVIAIDEAGNESTPVVVQVKDITPPASPEVGSVTENTTVITGQVEAGSEVVAVVSNKEIGRTTSDADENFEIEIAKQAIGTEIIITATDKVGNTSPSTMVVVSKQLDRIFGYSRYDTAVEISDRGWDSAQTVILTRGDNFADALAGVPLAYKLDAPILMTPSTKLWESTLSEIKRLGANEVIILGGAVAVSDAVSNKLEQEGLNVRRISGYSRYETAALIAKEVAPTGSSKVVIANGQNFPDALSVASHAAKQGLPILLTPAYALPEDTNSALAELGATETIIVGGEIAVSDAIESQLPAPVRLEGFSRYDTNVAITEHFGVENDYLFIATGKNYADALTGAVLAAKEDSGILLVHHAVPGAVSSYLQKQNVKRLTIFGGEVAVSRDVLEDLGGYLD